MKQLHLICNAHLDPVWLWNWEDGIAAALSTFRTAAKFCEDYDEFIFNHNEAILYQWVEEYEPELFHKIQQLVKAGKWHIIGGWYLQPDCNMPSGESLIRQIQVGRRYFWEKFGVKPTTAINFDPFGHSRGLVQILKKSGYDSYVFCRPLQDNCILPNDDFIWCGFDDSQIMAHRSSEHYNSLLGKAEEKARKWITEHEETENGLLLWGVGNHGGGPSRVDMAGLKKVMAEQRERIVKHSTPEQFFEERRKDGNIYPIVEKDLNSWAIGCYTSQIRIKQKHRRLENELFMVEKMFSHACLHRDLEYPLIDIHTAQEDLLAAQFHDILPGSAIPAVEEAGLRLMDHGLEILSKLKIKAFFKLAAGQAAAKEGEIPILIYNPHPYEIEGIFECEFQLQDQNWDDYFVIPRVFQGERELLSQVEKESCNINLDWIKKISFYAKLKPSQMNRFDCRLENIKEKPDFSLGIKEDYKFITKDLEVIVNAKTGLIDSLKVFGKEFVKENSFCPIVLEGDNDPWRMRADRYGEEEGRFVLLEDEKGKLYSGIQKTISNVRVIEDGKVRTVIEAVMGYGSSYLTMHYKLPKKGSKIGIDVAVQWGEKGKVLKMEIPTTLKKGICMGETAYGVKELTADGSEMVSQSWNGIFSVEDDMGFTIINDGTYGSDYKDGRMRMSLIHSAAYSAHPIEGRELLTDDRAIPRIDQGERHFHFEVQPGCCTERRKHISSDSARFNQPPFVVSFFPSGAGKEVQPSVIMENREIILGAFYKQTESEEYTLRLYNSSGHAAETRIEIPYLGFKQQILFGKYEIKTFKINAKEKIFIERSMSN
ncbi:MAG: glycoside hydrolase family 38 C-terminal domain-containing protein [Muricomes sp.]|uniref:glycoside hydrolase family 38 C-terminal domain-containing protein n=1 Tax=Faecalicatena contorta TaxID=39482 RepID=UPI002ECB27A2|nr:glycoside hydrolase family 38 C-terminal domain-containing protein [Muricomes sp.]